MEGLHLTADLFECRCAAPLLASAASLAEPAAARLAPAGLTAVGDRWH